VGETFRHGKYSHDYSRLITAGHTVYSNSNVAGGHSCTVGVFD